MLKFKPTNVNPKRRRTGDCSTRALVSTLEITYEEALNKQTKWALKTYYDPTSKQVMEKVLEEYGFIKMKQPRKINGKKYLVKEIDQLLTQQQMKSGVLVTVANHHTCVKNGWIIDTWDCGNKAIGNYYIKVKTEEEV